MDFFTALLQDGTNFHPDDTFTDFVNDKGEPSFTPERASDLDALMDAAHDVCDKAGEDIYGIAITVFNTINGEN